MTVHQCAGKAVPTLLGLQYTIANHSMSGGRQECVYDQESGHIGCEDSGSGISAKGFVGLGHRPRSVCVSTWRTAEYGETPTCCGKNYREQGQP
jgi:hypothetical protein